MKEITKEEILQIDSYLKSEIHKIDSNIDVVNYSAVDKKEFLPKIVIPDVLKEKIKKQEKDKEYIYVLNNDRMLDTNPKIVMSNKNYNVIYETYGGRLSYFDSNFELIGNASYDNIKGTNFETIRRECIRLNFSTSQNKTVNLNIDRDNHNLFNVYSNGKNRIDSVSFDYNKKEITAVLCNCFMQKIIFDFDMSIKNIYIRKKISKQLTLNKNNFEVDSYSSLIKLIEGELDLHNLMTDGDIDVMNQKTFDARINFVKIISKEKSNIHNEIIYNHIENISNLFKKTLDSVHEYSNILRDSDKDKYLTFKDRNHDRNYYYPTGVIVFLLAMQKLDISLDCFLSPDVLESYSYLNTLANRVNNSFKEEIKQYKSIKPELAQRNL